MKQTSISKSGRNTTAITNPKTKSQNTTANTKSAGKTAQSSPSTQKSGFGRNTAAPYKQSKSLVKSVSASGSQKSGASNTSNKTTNASKSNSSNKSMSAGKSNSGSKSMTAGKSTTPANKAGSKMEVSNEFCKLKDFDIASDVLGGQKALLKLYGTALCETDCPNLRNIINTQLSEVATDQFDTFTYMNQRGMYPTEQAPAGKIKQAVTQFNKKAVFKKK